MEVENMEVHKVHCEGAEGKCIQRKILKEQQTTPSPKL